MALNLPSAKDQIDKERNLKTFSTGSLMLDLAIGTIDRETGLPGVRERTVVEAFGPNQTGKTLLAEMIGLSVLNRDPKYKIVWLLSEEPNLERMEALGLDLSRCLIWSYGSSDDKDNLRLAGEGLDIACEYVLKDPDVKLVVLDSIKALVSEAEMYDNKGKDRALDASSPVAQRANLLNRFLAKWVVSNLSDAILFMTNQHTESIGIDFAIGQNFKDKTSGGRGKEHMAFLRIRTESTSIDDVEHPITHNKPMIGLNLFYNLKKNKFARKTGNRRAVARFMFDDGKFDREDEVISMGGYLDIIQMSGKNWYIFGETKINGKDAAIEYLRANPDVRIGLEKAIIPMGEQFFKINHSKIKAKVALDA